MVLLTAVASFTACSSQDDFEYALYGHSNEFVLPMTGGGRQTHRAESAPQAVAAPADADAMWVADEAFEYIPQSRGADQVGWEDIAGQGVRHVIQTANINAQTNYFDEAVANLRAIAPSVGGYIESESLTTHGRRMLAIVLRVPVASFDGVLLQIANLADVRNLNQHAQDVTESFYDMVASLELRRIEEDRLLALIEETETISERLALEQRLSDTRIIIETYLAQLNNMAGQIAYSTITVNLTDIAEEPTIIATDTLGQRIGGAFGDSLDGTISAFQGIVVFFAGALIPMLLVAAVGFGAYKVVQRLRKMMA